MFKYYFKFFNSNTKEETNKILNINETINTRLNSFNLKIYMDDFDINHSKITDYKIVLEKELNGIYIKESVFTGEIYKMQKQVIFNNCTLNDFSDDANIKYKLKLEFYSGGILVYDGSEFSCEIVLKQQCENYIIDIDNSIRIGDFFELKNESAIENIDFSINVETSQKYNTLMYYFDFNSEENIDPGKYKVFGANYKKFHYVVSNPIFKNDFTYLHFFLKDSFDNVRYKKIKIITKENLNELMEIVSGDIYLSNITDKFNIFYNMKNVREIQTKLIITKKDNNKTIAIASKKIGLKNNNSNFVSIELLDNFSNIHELVDEAKNIELSFVINGTEKETNKINLKYDTSAPVITFSNLTDNYAVVKTSIEFFTVLGRITDTNLFYIGNDIKKYDFVDVPNYLLIYSKENLKTINYEDGTSEKLIKLNEYYITTFKSNNFTLLNYNDEQINNYKAVNDYCNENEKVFFINLDKNRLNTYERNLLSHNELCIKGPILESVISQKTLEIGNYYLVKIIIQKNTQQNIFDLGISEFDYSFLKYIDDSSISCELNRDKSINLNFESTRLVLIKSNAYRIINKFNDNNILSSKNVLKLGDISFIPLSLGNNDFFTTSQSFIFFDSSLNLKPSENIYSYPIVTSKNKPVKYQNYSIVKIDENIYNFSIDIPINDGINTFDIAFKDMLENTTTSEIKIEKQLNNIEVLIDESILNDVLVTKQEDEFLLSTLKDSILLKFIIKNQTLSNTQRENYLIVSSELGNTKHKIINEEGISYCFVDLYNIKNSKYQVYYDNVESEVRLVFQIEKIASLFLNCETNIITGNSSYFLKLNKNKFSTITLEWDNTGTIICNQLEKDGIQMIEIKRLDNSNFIEKTKLTIKVHDNKNLFKSLTKEVNVTFYNDTLIADYYITDTFLFNGQVINPRFNLEIKSFEKENIKQIMYYDPLELDFYKRKKYATYHNGVYVIENIVTPITKSSLDIEIVLNTNDNINITKKLFENNQICLSDDQEQLTCSYEKNMDKLNINIKNKNNIKISFKKALFMSNNIVFDEVEDIVFNGKETKKFSYNILNFTGTKTVQVKLINMYNKVITLNEEVLDFNNNKINGFIENLDSYNLWEYGKVQNLVFKNKNDLSGFYLKITNIFGTTIHYKLSQGNNYIEVLQVGNYEFELYYSNGEINKVFGKYFVEVAKNINEKIYIKNKSFKTCQFVTELILENLSDIPIYFLDPTISYYLNGNFIKEIAPYKIDGNLMYFDIEKKYGINKYIYQDKFITKILEEIIVNKVINEKAEIYGFTTKEETCFYISDNKIMLEKKAPLYFTSNKVRYVQIYSKDINRVFIKITNDNKETIIQKSFMPCIITCLDENKEKIDNLVYEIEYLK